LKEVELFEAFEVVEDIVDAPAQVLGAVVAFPSAERGWREG